MKNKLSILAVLVFVGCGPLGKYKAVIDPQAPVVQAPDWKEVYTDPYLVELIDSALVVNYDLKMAKEHINQAEAMLLGARLSYIPTLGLSPGISSSFVGDGLTPQGWKYNLAASSKWQLDIFSKINFHQSMKASVAQMNDYARAARSMMIASVAKSYYTLLMLEAELESSKRMTLTWERAVETIRALRDNGMADNVAVCQYEANYANQQAVTRKIENQIAEAVNVINLLVCRPAGTPVKTGTLDEQEAAPAISEMIPIEMLSARPDVQAAQRSMELAFYTTRDAWLNFFPRLLLTGGVGLVNPDNGAMTPMSLLADLGAGITMPLLNAGANISNLRNVRSRQEEARMEFDKTLLAAGVEVNDALNAYNARVDMIEKYKIQVADLLQACIDTEYMMKNSTDKTYLDVLIAYTSYSNAEFALIEARAEKLQYAVAIYSSIGGGAS